MYIVDYLGVLLDREPPAGCSQDCPTPTCSVQTAPLVEPGAAWAAGRISDHKMAVLSQLLRAGQGRDSYAGLVMAMLEELSFLPKFWPDLEESEL